jgi:hypothetical protein
MKTQAEQPKAKPTLLPSAEKQGTLSSILNGYGDAVQKQGIEEEEPLQKKENDTDIIQKMDSGEGESSEEEDEEKDNGPDTRMILVLTVNSIRGFQSRPAFANLSADLRNRVRTSGALVPTYQQNVAWENEPLEIRETFEANLVTANLLLNEVRNAINAQD